MPFVIMRTNYWDDDNESRNEPVAVVTDEGQAVRMVDEANAVAEYNLRLIRAHADRSLMRNIPWDGGAGGLVEVRRCTYWEEEVPDLSEPER